MKTKLIILLFCCSFLHYQSISQESDNITEYRISQLDSIFQVLKASEQYESMFPYAKLAVSKAKKQYGAQDTLYARMLYNLGFAYDFSDDAEKGLELYHHAAKIQKEKLPNSVDYINTLSAIIDLYIYYDMEYNETEKLYLEILDIQSKTQGKDHPDYASTLNFLGYLYCNIGRYKEAKAAYLQSIEIRKKVIGKEHPDYAESLNYLGLLEHILGNYDKAEVLYLESKRIRVKALGKEDLLCAESSTNLSFLYHDLGRYNEAELLCLETLDIRKKAQGKDHPDFGLSLNNLAGLYDDMGRSSEAEVLYLESQKIFGEALGKDHPYYATSLNNLAALYQEKERYTEAEKLFLEAKQIRLENLGKEHPKYGRSLTNLASLYIDMGNSSIAEALFLEDKQIIEKSLGKKHPDYATTLHDLASLLEDEKRFEEAEALYLEEMDINASVFGKKHPYYASSLNFLASFYYNTNRYSQAWTYLNLAIKSICNIALNRSISPTWADSIKNTDIHSYMHLEEIDYSLDIAYHLLEKDSTRDISNQQNVLSDLALFLIKKRRNNFNSSEDQLRELSKANKWMQLSLANLYKQNKKEKGFEIIEQNKSVLLQQALHSKQAYQIGILPDSLVLLEKKLSRKHDRLQAQLLEERISTEKDSLRSQLNQLNFEIKSFKEKIELEYPEYSKLKYIDDGISIKEAQTRLDNETALIEYVVADSALYIFYIDNKQSKFIQFPIKKTQLNKNINRFIKVLSDYDLISHKKNFVYHEFIKSAYWFYEKTLAPVLDMSKKIEHLIIIPDGELGHLPFETFLVESAPQGHGDYTKLHYLLKDYRISYNYSASLWKENLDGEKTNHNNQILAMAANYEIGLTPEAAGSRLPAYKRLREIVQPLPAARKEVEALSKEFEGFFGFDNMASEKIFKEKASQYGIIHLAMHGLLDQRAPIMSSLAFTEDSDSNQNNFLHAYEISKIELNANLVVLSACETGYGKFETGNGIASLARSFMHAGASSLIVSLWQVNDLATSEIMKKLYHNLADGMDKAEALRQAKLNYIKRAKGFMAHPAFWSPFIQMGDSAPLSISRKGGWIYWGIGIIVILGSILLVTLLIRKRAIN